MGIRYYSHGEIDKDAWDAYIQQSQNGLLYATSAYLDHMSPGWSMLQDEETESVMPLPAKQSWHGPTCLQPPFVQQLGVFSRQPVSERMLRAFIEKAGALYDLLHMYLNYQNPLPESTPRCNYVIDLNQRFETIRQGFRKDLISRAMAHKLEYVPGNLTEAFALYRERVWPGNKTLSPFHLQQFQKLVSQMAATSALVRKIISKDGRTLSIALFLCDARRIYYMLSANTPEGKNVSANALLLYEMIRESSNQQRLFDFEGSEIPGVRFFFEKFSPVKQPYYEIRIDNMGLLKRQAYSLYRHLRGR